MTVAREGDRAHEEKMARIEIEKTAISADSQSRRVETGFDLGQAPSVMPRFEDICGCIL